MAENQEALSAEQSQGSRTTGSAHEILVKARKLIEKPENWTKGTYKCGNAYCADGALLTVSGRLEPGCGYWTAFRTLNELTGGLVTYNDSHEHADVLAAFDKAIAAVDAGAAS